MHASITGLIKKAVVNKQITKPQGNAMLRHKKQRGARGGPLHSEGHLLFMLKLMIEKHLTFKEAHQRAQAAVGR